MRQIEQLLIVGVRVDRGHLRIANAELFMNYLRQRSQAVGCAGSIRNHMVRAWIILLFVNAQHDRDVFVPGRRGNDHFLNPAAKVLLCVLGFGEAAGGFDHYLSAD